MVAGNIYPPYAAVAGPGKCSNELQEFLQNMSVKDEQAGSIGDGGTGKRMRTREVASRYKAATISSSQAAVVTAQRYQTPSRGRSPSPNLGRNTPQPDSSAPKTRAFSADRRPVSVERRRPWPSSAAENKAPNMAMNYSGPLSYKKSQGRGLDGLWPSTNSLPSSFKSDASHLLSHNSVANDLDQHSEAADQTLKPTPNGANKNSFSTKALRQGKFSERKETSERRTATMRRHDGADQRENSKPIDSFASAIEQHRWPGASSAKALMSKSMDLSSSSLRRAASLFVPSRYRSAPKVEKSVAPDRTLSRSISVGANRNVVRRIYSDSRDMESISLASKLDYRRGVDEKTSAWENGGALRESAEEAVIGSLLNGISFDEIGSDTESSSSGALSVASGDSVRGAAKGTIVPARFWQDTTNRLGQNTGASVWESVDGGKLTRRSKAASPITTVAPATSNSTRSITPTRSTSGPLATLQSPSSPSSQARSVQSTSPSRGWASPTITRPLQAMCSALLPLNGRQILNPSFDMRKGRKGVSQQEEAHDLRLLHNRWLQWRFVNARAEMALDTQTAVAESLLHGVTLGICDLQMSVATKLAQRNKIMQTLKLKSVLDSHGAQLVQWSSLQSEHSTALTAVMKALESAIIRVPVTGGPKVDVQTLKEVLSSGMDIVDALGPFVSKCLHQAKLVDALLSELAKVAVLEKASLQECGDLLAAFSALETEERSLRMYLIQVEQEKPRSMENRLNLANSILAR